MLCRRTPGTVLRLSLSYESKLSPVLNSDPLHIGMYKQESGRRAVVVRGWNKRRKKRARCAPIMAIVCGFRPLVVSCTKNELFQYPREVKNVASSPKAHIICVIVTQAFLGALIESVLASGTV